MDCLLTSSTPVLTEAPRRQHLSKKYIYMYMVSTGFQLKCICLRTQTLAAHSAVSSFRDWFSITSAVNCSERLSIVNKLKSNGDYNYTTKCCHTVLCSSPKSL